MFGIYYFRCTFTFFDKTIICEFVSMKIWASEQKYL